MIYVYKGKTDCFPESATQRLKRDGVQSKCCSNRRVVGESFIYCQLDNACVTRDREVRENARCCP